MYNVLVSAHTIKLIERAIKRLFCAMKVPKDACSTKLGDK